MIPRPKRLKLRGPKEQAVQGWILASLGVEQFVMRKNKREILCRVSLNVWVGDGGRTVFYRNNTGATRTAAGGFMRYGLGPGGADIIGCAYGAAIALEVKREGEYQTADQRDWQARWERAGGQYRVVRSPSEALAVITALRGPARCRDAATPPTTRDPSG